MNAGSVAGSVRSCLENPHGREAVFAGCDARSEERSVVVPLKRRATQQRARKGASRLGFDANGPDYFVARLADALRPFDAARVSSLSQCV